jgi:transcription elongation GreA/GreB family factor
MKQPLIKKRTLITIIINQLEQALAQAINAANEAHAAAVDDQSIAETQYDTLAIEASYLAEGQSRRVKELQTSIHQYQGLTLLDFDEDKPVALTALVQLSNDIPNQHWFFIGPTAGGMRCTISDQTITVITPQSPMGMALIGKYQEDEIDIKLGNKQLSDYLSQVI